jgi:hypothetical protein
MEMTINIGYDQVLKLASQLPYKDKKKLTRAIERDLEARKKKAAAANGEEELSELQRLILQGPVMTDEQFNDFKAMRKSFNKWIEK